MSRAGGTGFWELRDRMREYMIGRGGLAATEEREAYDAAEARLPLDERLIQTIWAQQLFGSAELRLADGRHLRVLDPGRWNGSAGPDFRDARLMIDETPVTGDVEIHLRASDWWRHGHDRDLDYNGVVLHAVLENDDARLHDALHNGTLAPRFELEPFIFPDLDTLRRSLTVDDLQYGQPTDIGRCHTLMCRLDGAFVAEFLDRAGEERLLAKTRRLEEQSRNAAPDQVFHQAMMMTLGTGPGKTLYYLLAKRTPLAEMLDFARELPEPDWALGLEALMLAVAGLLPDDAGLADAPPEARERAKRLRALWQRLEPWWSDRVIPPTRRWFQGIRPVNFPTRRLAAMALLLARSLRQGRMPLEALLARLRSGAPTLQHTVPRRRRHPLLKDLLDWLVVPGEGHFWGTHYTFTARPAASAMNLIGESTAMSLVFNALLPAALMMARREGDQRLADAVMRLFRLIPPLQNNHITTFMTRRLFGDGEAAGALLNTEQRNQGLFQIFHHCCHGEAHNCDACYYLAEAQSRMQNSRTHKMEISPP